MSKQVKSIDWAMLAVALTILFILSIVVFEDDITDAPDYVALIIILAWIIPAGYCLIRSLKEEM